MNGENIGKSRSESRRRKTGPGGRPDGWFCGKVFAAATEGIPLRRAFQSRGAKLYRGSARTDWSQPPGGKSVGGPARCCLGAATRRHFLRSRNSGPPRATGQGLDGAPGPVRRGGAATQKVRDVCKLGHHGGSLSNSWCGPGHARASCFGPAPPVRSGSRAPVGRGSGTGFPPHRGATKGARWCGPFTPMGGGE